MSEIWKACWEKIKSDAQTLWQEIVEFCDEKFIEFKEGLIGFCSSLCDWIIALFVGTYKILSLILNALVLDIGDAIIESIKLIFDKLIAWIQKW